MKSRLFSLKSRKREATRIARKPYFKTLDSERHYTSRRLSLPRSASFYGRLFYALKATKSLVRHSLTPEATVQITRQNSNIKF